MTMLTAVVTAKKIASLRMYSPPVGGRQQCLLGAFDAPPRKEDPERDQYQAQDENNSG